MTDDALNPISAAYRNKGIFCQLYIAEETGKDRRIKAILRDLKRGIPATNIALQIQQGTFNVQKGAKR